MMLLISFFFLKVSGKNRKTFNQKLTSFFIYLYVCTYNLISDTTKFSKHKNPFKETTASSFILITKNVFPDIWFRNSIPITPVQIWKFKTLTGNVLFADVTRFFRTWFGIFSALVSVSNRKTFQSKLRTWRTFTQEICRANS